MAEQKRKSQAEKAASAKKNKSGAKKTTNKKDAKNTGKQETVKKEREIPVRFITSVVYLGMFVLLLVIFLNPEGALTRLFENIILGLVGNVGYVVAIPGFLYLFFIHAFSGKRPVLMRSICVAAFILLCGGISHLILNPQNLSSGIEIMRELYIGGANGSTGGILCGGITMLVKLLCGTAITYILYILAAIFTLLGAMQITIPSIIRAIKNRPRPQWEDEEEEEPQEPAAVVVNHIAAKRIARIEQQRIKAEAQLIEEETLPADITPTQEKQEDKVSDMMRQIGAEIEAPVNAAAVPEKNAPTEDVEIPDFVAKTVKRKTKPIKDIPEEPIPSKMPELEHDTPQQAVPVVVKPKKVTAKESEEAAAKVAKEIAEAEQAAKVQYCYPPIDLLKSFGSGGIDGTSEMRENSRRLNETLASFKIEAHIINVTRGPSVTRYEVELEKGVRLNKLTTAADDIALSLGASGVRIAAVPGKISVVGIEVPNKAVTTVSLREVIDSGEFSKAKSKSSFAVGKDISGNCIVGNIAKLPHMLIAGTTGSGKSVCMNSIIISLLY